jgi:hypothetical protein
MGSIQVPGPAKLVATCLAVWVMIGLASPGSASAAPRYRGYSEHTVAANQLDAGTAAFLSAWGGANVARVTFDWRWAEPSRNRYDFRDYDRIYWNYLSMGVRPLFTVLFAPSWALESGVRCDQYTTDCTYPPGRAYDGEWREILAILARRYPWAVGIEIWNEPNTLWFWAPRPDVRRYTDLLKQAYSAIKGVNPAMPVVGGAILNMDATTPGITSLTDFARGMYLNGARSRMNALSVHPYPVGFDQVYFRDSLDDLRRVRDSYGDAAKPLWVTEFGFTTTGTHQQHNVTPRQQADGLVAHWRAMAAMPDIKLVTMYTLMDSRRQANFDPADPEVGFGVLDRFGNPKPAYCALGREWGKNACPGGVPEEEAALR